MGETFRLNDGQRQAVSHDDGPALVVAGAGTGKTLVLVERIVRLIEGGTDPSRILALTFTEKAATEMSDRVIDRLGRYELEIPIMTFNAYGETLLRRYAADMGLGRNFTLMGESAQIVFLRERLDQLDLDYFAPVSHPDAMLSDLRDYFSRLKQQVITPVQHAAYVKKMPAGDGGEKMNRQKYQELAVAYERYTHLCREGNVIDYDDQIYLVLQLFAERPNILKEVQDQYDFVLVDEFQDTNTMQARLVDHIVTNKQNLQVVGDDDQSIYGWRGATLANILDFKDRYPRAAEISLTENYRSTSAILQKAYALIQHNNPDRLETKLGINKQLTTLRKGTPPDCHHFETLDEELSWIAKDIQARLASGADPASIAVLARRNATLRKLHGYLDFDGVEHVVIGQRYELYHEPIVRQILEGLKAVVDPDDSIALYHTLVGPFVGLDPLEVSSWSASSRREHTALWQTVQTIKSNEARQAVKRLTSWREKLATLTVGQLAYEIVTSSGYKDELYARAGKETAASLTVSRLSELFNTMKEFEEIAVVPSAIQYVQSLPALQAAGDTGEDDTLDLSNHMVNLLTIHKAKGLEWPIVYIADCTEGSFPLRSNARGIALPVGLAGSVSGADSHLAEERRLMYVAMTRAKNELIFTYADRHASGSLRKPSRFLDEALGNNHTHRTSSGGAAAPQLPTFVPVDLPAVPLPARIRKGDQLTLTVSQVQKYLDCPLDFFYCYVLHVPQEASPAQEYGNLMHDLLQSINESLMTGKELSLTSLEKQLTKAWPRQGHLSAQQRERAQQRAFATLRRLYKELHAQKRVPLAVEQAFRFALPDAKLTIKGRFDAVFPQGSGVEIVDYKTSSAVDSPEKAKQRATGSQQLALYALAWQKLHDVLPAQVSLDFIDTGMVGSVRKTQRGIDGLVERLDKAADGLRAHDFSPGLDHKFCIHPPVD